MKNIKRFFKRNSHNSLFKILAGLGRALNRLYENRNDDMFSNGEITVIKKIAKFNPLIMIDGGANLGNNSLTFSKYSPACKVYAFEPVEGTFNKMLNNIKENFQIIPVQKGLFSANCEKEINLFNSIAHSSIYDIKGLNYQSTNKETIALVKGDDFVQENKIDTIDFLKLDLEGAEYDAILGFHNCLKERKIKAIQFEYGYINITTKKLLVDFYELFEEYGYVVGKIYPKNVAFKKYEFKDEDFIGPNFIAVDKNEKELIDSLSRK